MALASICDPANGGSLVGIDTYIGPASMMSCKHLILPYVEVDNALAVRAHHQEGE